MRVFFFFKENFTKLLSELTAEQVFNAFHGFPIQPDYLNCDRKKAWSMHHVHNILNYDSYVNMVQVVDSPNFPSAGKGLINIRPQPISENTGMPYWGCLFVHDSTICDVNENDVETCFS